MRKKEPSNLTDSPDRRFTLPKSHILRGRRNFERLFSDSSLISSPNVNLRYATYFNDDHQFFVGFIVPNRIGNAVKRIHLKRLLREAYRLNQHIITDLSQSAAMGVHFVFIAKHANLDFEAVQKEVTHLLNQLRKRLLSKTSVL